MASDVHHQPPLRTPKPVRASLKAIWRGFKRCLNRYPSIYHELWEPQVAIELALPEVLKPVVLEGTSVVITDVPSVYGISDSFRRATNQFDLPYAWSQWHEPPRDGRYFGCFYGDDGAGFHDFAHLADSAYLQLRQVQPELPDDLFHGWMAVLHRMADRYPTPLLRSDSMVWRSWECESEADHKRWIKPEHGAPYPKHPVQYWLKHDVVTSSMAAIDLILDDEQTILVGDKHVHLGYPFAWLTGAAESAAQRPSVEDTPEQPAAEAATTEQPQNIFRLEGPTWHLRFVDGDDVEEGHFPNLAGFHHYAKLLANPGEVFAYTDMGFFSKAKRRERPTGFLSKAKQRERPTQDDEETENLKDGFQIDHGDHSQRVQDPQGIAQVLKEFDRLDENIEIAKRSGQAAKITDAEKARADFRLHARKLFDKFHRVRKVGRNEQENARKRVSKALAECRDELKKHEKPLVKLKQHLENCVKYQLGFIWYRPHPPVRWQTDRPS